MVILVDCDGVLADFIGSLCTALNDGTTVSQFTDWGLEDCLGAQKFETALSHISKRGFCFKIAPYIGAWKFVRTLQKSSHTVLCVTAPHDSDYWIKERREWLEPIIHPTNTLFVHSECKQHVKGDILIEDNPLTVQSWISNNPGGTGILFDRPWNQEGSSCWAPPHKQVCRVRNYEEALHVIQDDFSVLSSW